MEDRRLNGLRLLIDLALKNKTVVNAVVTRGGPAEEARLVLLKPPGDDLTTVLARNSILPDHAVDDIHFLGERYSFAKTIPPQGFQELRQVS